MPPASLSPCGLCPSPAAGRTPRPWPRAPRFPSRPRCCGRRSDPTDRLEAVVARAAALPCAASRRTRWRIAQLHRQADALARHIHLHHLDLDDVAGLDDFARVVDELVRQLAHMHQAVLVHAQVDEGAELGHVAHRALQDHAFAQVADVVHAVVEARHLEVRARIAAGLFQLAQDVLDRDHAELLVGKQLGPQRLEHVGAAHQLGHRLAGGFP